MGRLSLALLLSALACVPACAPGRSPDLLEVDEIAPHAVERGTHLELGGAGFPDRRTARVAFVGKVHRPAEPPRSVTIRTTARADSRSHLTLNVSGELLRQFLDGAPHGTFRGSVAVSFGARTDEAPALGGRLDGVVIDFFGDAAERHGAEQKLAEQGKAFSGFLGLRLNESFEITEVVPNHEGERAGLALGDRVVALDGVRLDTEGDLAPRPDGRTSEIVVRRAGLGDLSRPLDRAGFRPQRISDLAPSIALVSAALLLMLLLLGRGARAWALFEARLAERFERAQKLAGRRGLLSFAALPGATVNAGRTPLSLRVVPYVGFFAVSVALSALALGHPLPSGETDLPIWVSSAGAASAIAAFVRGGRKISSRSRQTFRLGQGLAAAAQALLLFLPVVIAAALAVYGDGSLRLSDIVAAQGSWPTAWRALESPWSLLAFALLVFSQLPDAGARPVPAEEALAARTSGDAAGQVGRGVAWHMAELLEWLGLVVTCALGATVFLGGWCAPGGVPLLGAALLLAKTWALVCAVSFARQVLAIRRSESWSVWARFCLPLAFVSLALHVIATSTGFARAEGPALELSASALLVCVVAYCVARSLRAARRKLPNLAINPWL